jgi:RNA recognition motif-containing protein
MDVESGRVSGFAVVVLRDREMAEKAINELDKKEIGTRWIGVSACNLQYGASNGNGDRYSASAYEWAEQFTN